MKKTQKGSITVILVAIIVLLIIGFGAYIYYQNNSHVVTQAVPVNSIQSNSGWQTYNEGKFSINYPSGWVQQKVVGTVMFKSPNSTQARPVNVAVNIIPSGPVLNASYQIAQFSKTSSLTKSTIQIGSTTATEFIDSTSPLAPASFVIFEQNGQIYNLSVTGIDKDMAQVFYQSFKIK